MKKKECYIYTRVSTSMQVDGYSLDAQKDKLRKYADFQDMVIVGEYSDEGKSGKSVEGRPEFLQMLRDIEEGKDHVSFVLVFKLSRFGRNAADVLTSLQKMQDFGVNLLPRLNERIFWCRPWKAAVKKPVKENGTADLLLTAINW